MRIRKNKRRIDPRYFLHETQINEQETTESETTEPETTEPETTEPETTEPEAPEVPEVPEAPEAEAPPPEEEEPEPGRNERQKQKHREGKALLGGTVYDNYEDFYKGLEEHGLTDKLGRAAKDKIWGKKHQQAWEALMQARTKIPKSMTDPAQREAYADAFKEYVHKRSGNASRQFEEVAKTSGNKKAAYFAALTAEIAGEKDRAAGLYKEFLKRDDLNTVQRTAAQKNLAEMTSAETPIETSAAATGEEITPGTLRQGAAEVAKQKRDARIAKRSDRHRRRVAKQTGRDPVTGEKARVVDTANTQLFLVTKGQKGRVEPPKIVLPGEPEYDDARDAEPGDPTYQEKELGGVVLEPSTHDSLATDYEGRRTLVGAPEEEPIPAANLGDVALAGELQGGSAQAVDEAVELQLKKLRDTGANDDEAELLELVGKRQLDKVDESGIRALVSAQKNGSIHAGAILNGMQAGLRDRERELDKDIRTIEKFAGRITKLKNILKGEERLGNPDPEYTRTVKEQLRSYGTRLYWRKQSVKEFQAKVGRLRTMFADAEDKERFAPSDREALEKATAEEMRHRPEAARARTAAKWAEEEATDRARAAEERRRKAAEYDRERERRLPPVRQERERLRESLNRNTRSIKIRINKRRRQ